MTEATDTKVEAAVQNVRPLNATQSRNLKDLVENDFHTLMLEIQEISAENLRTQLEELGKSTTEAAQKKFESKAEKLIQKYQNDRLKLIQEAREQNMTLAMPTIDQMRHGITVTDEVFQKRKRELELDSKREMDAIMLVLRRKKNEAMRKVMIASITSQAEDILASIPSAREFMIAAQAEKAAKAIES